MVDDDKVGDDEEGETSAPGSEPPYDRFPKPPEIAYSRPSLHRTNSATGSAGLAGQGDDSHSDNVRSRSIGRSLAAGSVAITSPLGGAIVGLVIDVHFVKHGSVLWTVVFTLLGILSGFISMFRILDMGKRDRK